MSDTSETKEDLRLLYQVTVADLSYFKTQQWSVTNYALLLFAALVGVSQFIESPSVYERVFLCILAFAALSSALVILAKLQTSILVRQARLAAAMDNFSPSFKKAWAAEPKGREFVHSIYFLKATVVIGGILTLWFIGLRM